MTSDPDDAPVEDKPGKPLSPRQLYHRLKSALHAGLHRVAESAHLGRSPASVGDSGPYSDLPAYTGTPSDDSPSNERAPSLLNRGPVPRPESRAVWWHEDEAVKQVAPEGVIDQANP